MNLSGQAAQRKNDHIRLANKQQSVQHSNDFDRVKLLRPTLPETHVQQRSLLTDFFSHHVSAPFFINAITGGTDTATKINCALSRIARKHHLVMAFGSANIVGKDPQRLQGFLQARQENPDGPIIINVNPTTPIETIQTLIKQLKPVALQIHVNAVQEIVMPEGERDFRWITHIKQVKDAVTLPVIVKEVGFGFDIASIGLLAQLGVDAIDISGQGGTNFALIENSRRTEEDDFSYLADSGFSTVQSLINAQLVRRLFTEETQQSDHARNTAADTPQTMPFIIASGGVRNPLDVLKSLVLGAKWVGVSGSFLHTLLSYGEDALDKRLTTWKQQLRSLLALYGIQRLSSVHTIDWITDNELESYMRQMNHKCGFTSLD